MISRLVSVAHSPNTPDLVRSFVIDRVYPAESTLAAGGAAAAECMAGPQETARASGLWALPLPAELGGCGLDLAVRTTAVRDGDSWSSAPLHRTARSARILDGPDEVHVQAVARRLLTQ